MMKITEAQLRREIRKALAESKTNELNEASIVAAAAKAMVNRLKKTNDVQEEGSESLQSAIKNQFKHDEQREYEEFLRKTKLNVKDQILRALETSKNAAAQFAPKIGGNPEFVSLGVVDGLLTYIDTLVKQYYTKMTTGKDYIYNRDAAEKNAAANKIYDPKNKRKTGTQTTTDMAPTSSMSKTTTQLSSESEDPEK